MGKHIMNPFKNEGIYLLAKKNGICYLLNENCNNKKWACKDKKNYKEILKLYSYYNHIVSNNSVLLF